MKTKAQKAKAVEEGLGDLKKSETVILADFTGLTVNELNGFRKTLKAIGAPFRVMKKRLVKVMLEKEGIAFDPKEFAGQTGVVFSPKDSLETSGVVWKFSRQFPKTNFFKILGGFEVKTKKFIPAEDVKKLGQLPGREVLLGQLAYVLISPIRSLLYVMDQRSKQTVEAK